MLPATLTERTAVPPPDAGRRAERLRVMHLLLKFGFGGSEGGVLKLVNGHDRARFEPSICSCLPADAIKARLAPDVQLVEMTRRDGTDLAFVRELVRVLTRVRPHVLHTHGWATLLEGLVAARLAGVPLVVHGEHGTLETRPHNLWLQRLAWKRVDQVLSVSQRLAEKMAATVGFPLEQIKTITNGVDLDRFSPRRYDAVGVSEEVVVGTVGRLLPVKDHRGFLEAIGIVRRRGGNVKALLIGDGPLASELRAFADTNQLSPITTFLGNRVDVEQLLATIDIFVSSSVSEGMSNTVLEAMATGAAVVATDVGGTSELVRHGVTGTLVPPSDPTAMADAIQALVDDPARRAAMGQAARRRAESEFAMPLMVRRYEELYSTLAEARLPGWRVGAAR